MPKGNGSSGSGNIPNIKGIELEYSPDKSTNNINDNSTNIYNQEPNTKLDAKYENCDTKQTIQEGGLKGLIFGRTEKTEIDCSDEKNTPLERDRESESNPQPNPHSKSESDRNPAESVEDSKPETNSDSKAATEANTQIKETELESFSETSNTSSESFAESDSATVESFAEASSEPYESFSENDTASYESFAESNTEIAGESSSELRAELT